VLYFAFQLILPNFYSEKLVIQYNDIR